MFSSCKLAPEISGLLSSIFIAVIVDSALMTGINDEDELIQVISRNCRKKSSSIAVRYAKEYTNRGALLYNRICKHQSNDTGIRIDIDFRRESDNRYNYLCDNLFCQKAVLHIGIASTGSSGTAFKISDEYALTCAHVVDNAKEVTANVIAGDGYPTDRWKDFGVYDVGFGEVVYSNPCLDIAVLKTDYCGSCYLEIEQEGLLPEIGEEVIVFGYPFGGILSRYNRVKIRLNRANFNTICSFSQTTDEKSPKGQFDIQSGINTI
ncbi:MAG: trypsin-like peptidase domain-containing protein [Oscillospiraceae bacterium]|nr:trypsin-like peptidase domain-containing protein [Oscillospiraceae bacterium]